MCNHIPQRIILTFLLPVLIYSQTTEKSDVPELTTTGSDIFHSSVGECQSSVLPLSLTEWQDRISSSYVRVEWGYDNDTCNSMNSCFGMALPINVPLEPQIVPVQVQQGVNIRFQASTHMDVPFQILPYSVDEIGFRACDFSRGKAIIDELTGTEFAVSSKFLGVGTNYFIAQTSDPLFKCHFGLRLNITVKSEKCSGVGERVHCWNRGRCVTDTLAPSYYCKCCHGFTGQFCEHLDACVTSPCQNGGSCIYILGDSTGTMFACNCALGYFGTRCESHVENLCEINPCENNATCSGNQSDYICHCSHGYSGHHCEVDNNNCATNPCIHGVCVDKTGGHQCYCTPGYGGLNCDHEFNECQSNPCRNGGFCVDMTDGFECQCSRGYAGQDCSVKVDLCNPSPCENATECIDYGLEFSCTCNPGFTGAHCEININECESNPCLNHGKCRDLMAGYSCICPEGVSGLHCEYKRLNLPKHILDRAKIKKTHLGPLHVHNLYMVAGTLGGALLIALSVLAGCYCKVHETYRIFYRSQGYKQQTNESLREKRASSARKVASNLSESHPSMEAILEATSYSYSDNSLNSPLVSSLRPKRV